MFPVAGDSRSGELSASFAGSIDKHISKVCNWKTSFYFIFLQEKYEYNMKKNAAIM